MFKLMPKDKPRIFKKKVEFQVPNEDGGYSKGSFMATYQQIPSEEATSTTGEMTAKQFGQRVLVGFDDVVDPDDQTQKVPFSDEARDLLLEEPVIAVAVRDTYWAALAGGQLKRKN
jgi:hypothetical protein